MYKNNHVGEHTNYLTKDTENQKKIQHIKTINNFPSYPMRLDQTTGNWYNTLVISCLEQAMAPSAAK